MFDGLRKKIGEFRENVVERIKAKDESEELEEEKVVENFYFLKRKSDLLKWL